jgi:hypothetical protein
VIPSWWKYRWYGIILFTVILIYPLAITPLLDQWTKSSHLTNEISRANGAGTEIEVLQTKKELIEKVFLKFSADSNENKEIILQTLSDFCKKDNVRIVEFPTENSIYKGGFKIETNKIVAEGKFHDLIKLIHYLEYERVIGKISSVAFLKFKEPLSHKEILRVTIYLQNYSSL